MRISDWSLDVCSSDLEIGRQRGGGAIVIIHRIKIEGQRRRQRADREAGRQRGLRGEAVDDGQPDARANERGRDIEGARRHRMVEFKPEPALFLDEYLADRPARRDADEAMRSEEHTSELQSLMRISSDVLCLKKKK